MAAWGSREIKPEFILLPRRVDGDSSDVPQCKCFAADKMLKVCCLLETACDSCQSPWNVLRNWRTYEHSSSAISRAFYYRAGLGASGIRPDRKSTRLNSSHIP